MALSDTQIANMALAHVGARATISALTEQSAEARACNLWYEWCRKTLLEAFDWNFARRRATLALHGDVAPNDWSFRYQYPSDCARMRLIWNPLGLDADAVPFEVAWSDNGTKCILTDAESAIGIYTKDVTDTGLYPGNFVQALSRLLASQIAFTLTGKQAVAQDQFKIAVAICPALADTLTASANEGIAHTPRDASWVRDR